MSGAERTPRRGGVQSVDRALDLLEALGSGGPQGVSELVRRTGLPLGTVHRLLATLAARGYVHQDPERRYRVGAAALGLADASQQGLVWAGRPVAARMTAVTGESCNLAVLQGAHMVYVAQSPSPRSLRIFAEVGRQVPLHSTAVGKAVLASLPWAQAQALLGAAEPLERSTEFTLTDPGRLRAELQAVAERGYAVDEQERELGVRCVAVAVPGTPGLHAALSVSGPAERFGPQDALGCVPELTAAAAELGAAVTGRATT